jgi:hypothetical protein
MPASRRSRLSAAARRTKNNYYSTIWGSSRRCTAAVNYREDSDSNCEGATYIEVGQRARNKNLSEDIPPFKRQRPSFTSKTAAPSAKEAVHNNDSGSDVIYIRTNIRGKAVEDTGMDDDVIYLGQATIGDTIQGAKSLYKSGNEIELAVIDKVQMLKVETPAAPVISSFNILAIEVRLICFTFILIRSPSIFNPLLDPSTHYKLP